MKKVQNMSTESRYEALVAFQKRFLVYQGTAMSVGGLVWGTMLVWANVASPSIIPYGYVILTAINFWYFYRTKNFTVVRHVQTFISLLLPFMLQWWLGGFEQSGSVMLWSMLALASSATYLDVKSSLFWLTAFIILTLLSYYFDSYFVSRFTNHWPKNITSLFLLLNIILNGAIIFLLFLYYVEAQKRITNELMKTYTKLLNSEKLAALGQVSAGVAHEVNTPLGAIKSSAEESSIAFQENLIKLPETLSKMNEEEKKTFVEFVATVELHTQALSTIEEREKKKILKAQLEELNVDNNRFIADRMVQVGVFEVTPAMKKLSKLPQFENLLMVAYNMLNQQKKTILLSLWPLTRHRVW